jgi:fucose permease
MGEDQKTEDGMVPLVPSDGGGYYPPPASRTTIFGALFAFAYHAAAVAIPGGLDLLAAHGRNNMVGQSLPLSTTAAFWSGIAVTRFLALPCDRITRSKQGVPRTVLGAGGFLVLFWLSPSSASNTAVAAGLVGAMLGPVYPCVLSMVMRELGEDEMLGTTGIIVAFGHSGAVSALLASQLAAYIDTPVTLHLILVMVFGGMLVFWEGLTVKNDRGNVSDLRDNV